MLEYYTIGAGYLESLEITEELFAHLREKLPKQENPLPETPFIRITMEEAFRKWAGFSLSEKASMGKAAMEKEAKRLGLDPQLSIDPQPGTGSEPSPEGDKERAAIALLFDLIFIHAVEPSLPRERPVALLDYPAFVPCLAKNKPLSCNELAVKERWELYIHGVELANCYSEETRPEEIRRFFSEEAKVKNQNALVKHKIDMDYWEHFQRNTFPPCSGVAMGLDRLIMILSGQQCIKNALPFTF
jgi:lysyl-tRNA synthetase class 2